MYHYSRCYVVRDLISTFKFDMDRVCLDMIGRIISQFVAYFLFILGQPPFDFTTDQQRGDKDIRLRQTFI
jgi:hypothetical protein